jgi:hypothetical protein
LARSASLWPLSDCWMSGARICGAAVLTLMSDQRIGDPIPCPGRRISLD